MQTDLELWDPIFSWLGVDGASVLVTLLLISNLSNFFFRLIPDDSVGWKHKLKIVLKILGLYASNRIRSGVTVNDVAKEVIHSPIVNQIGDKPKLPIDLPDQVVPAFPRFTHAESEDNN